MKKAEITVRGITPYSPSRNYAADVPKLKDESADEFDARTWRNHAHVDRQTGLVIIPGDCLGWALKAMSQRRADKIKGKGQQTFTKVFDSCEVVGNITTGVKLDAVECESFMAHANGRRGTGARVLRRFPIVRTWGGSVSVLFWDDRILEDIFRETASDAGLLVGLGRRRPENKGWFGRFVVDEVKWLDRVDPMEELAQAAQ